MLNKEQIMEILPHRPPMLLVDEILEMDENHVVGALHLTVTSSSSGPLSGQPDYARGVPSGGARAGRRRSAAVSARIQGQDCGLHRHRQGKVPRNGQSRAIPFVWKLPSPSAAARWQ